ITVLQGESEIAAQNELLGEFMMTGLRKATRGEVDIDVIFDISAEGIVSVSALDVQTGQRQSITVTASSGLTEEEIKKAAQANQDWMLGQKEDPEFQERKTKAEEIFKEFEANWPRFTRAAANGLGQDPLQRAQADLLEPTNLRAREFLRSALERIHAHMGPGGAPANDTAQPGAAPAHPWLPARPLAVPAEVDPNAQTLMREPPPAPAGQGSPPQKPAAAAPAPVQAPRPMAQPPPP